MAPLRPMQKNKIAELQKCATMPIHNMESFLAPSLPHRLSDRQKAWGSACSQVNFSYLIFLGKLYSGMF